MAKEFGVWVFKSNLPSLPQLGRLGSKLDLHLNSTLKIGSVTLFSVKVLQTFSLLSWDL